MSSQPTGTDLMEPTVARKAPGLEHGPENLWGLFDCCATTSNKMMPLVEPMHASNERASIPSENGNRRGVAPSLAVAGQPHGTAEHCPVWDDAPDIAHDTAGTTGNDLSEVKVPASSSKRLGPSHDQTQESSSPNAGSHETAEKSGEHTV